MRRFELLDNNRVGVQFPYDEKAIQRIKTLPGRKWNATEKRWELPLSQLGECLPFPHSPPNSCILKKSKQRTP